MFTWLPAALVALAANSSNYARADLLIEADQLAALAADKIRVLDARPKEEYLTGHVPGAVRVDVADWSTAVSGEPDVKAWAERLAAAGVEPGVPVVAYATDPRAAARLWWILKYAGVDDARLLNGGWPAWEAARLLAEKTENKPAVTVAVWKLSRERLATKEEVLAKVKDRSADILDARTSGEFCGRTKLAQRAGAIPGAVHLEWTELLDPKTKKFKPMPELRQLLKERNIDPNQPAITYCQSGGRSAVLAFGLELIGGKQVRNYYKSWSEWGNDKDLPVEPGKR